MTNPVKWRFAPLPADQLPRIYMFLGLTSLFVQNRSEQKGSVI
jgi:hypothetical protein